MKYRCAGEVGALSGAIFYAAFGGENRTTGLRPRKTGQPRFARKVDALRARVDGAAGPDGPGLPGFCPGPADASRTGSGLPPSGVI